MMSTVRCLCKEAVQRSLGDTLGSESSVLVLVDPKEFPRTWQSLDLLKEAVGEAEYRQDRQQTAGAKGQTKSPTGEAHAVQFQSAVEGFCKVAHATLGDYHLDAKLFPHCHALRLQLHR